MHVCQLTVILPACFNCSAVMEQLPAAQPFLRVFRVTPTSAAVIGGNRTSGSLFLLCCASWWSASVPWTNEGGWLSRNMKCSVQHTTYSSDHLHSMISPCFNSYPRALLCLIHDLDTVAHAHCIWLVFRMQMHMSIILFSEEMLMHMHIGWNYHHCLNTCSQIAYMNYK